MSTGPKPPPPPAKRPPPPPKASGGAPPPRAPEPEAPQEADASSPLETAAEPAPPAAPPPADEPIAAPERDDEDDALDALVAASAKPAPAPKAPSFDPLDSIPPPPKPAPKPRPKIDPSELPDVSHIPDEPVLPANFAPMGGSELDAAITKMRKGSSPAVRALMGLVVVSGVGIGGYAYWANDQFAHREDRLDQINEMTNQAEVVPALIEELKANRFPDVKRRILRNLGHFRDARAVPAIVEQLQYAGPVRRDAARALAEIGLPGAEGAKQALLDVLPQTDARDRGQVIWSLVVLRETRAADAILEAFGRGELQNMQGFEPKRITRVVGVDKLSQPSLVNHSSSAVRLLVALTLSEVATAEAAGPLKTLLEAELARPDGQRNDDVVQAAASGLGRTGSPEAARPLFQVLTSNPQMRNDILSALGRSTAAPQLALLLREATDPTLRRELTKLLAATHDPRGADGLAGQLGSDDLDTRGEAAIGLAEVGDPRALPVLSELAKLRDHDDLRRRGLASLQYVASRENTRALIALMEEVPTTKASVLRALGRSGDPSVAPILTREIEGDDCDPAAYALGEMADDGAFAQVLRLAPRPPRVNMAASGDAERNSANQRLIMSRRAAIIALGRYGRPQAFDVLTTIVEDTGDDYELRSRAGQSLGQSATVEQMQDVITKIKNPGLNAAAREYYAHALWQRPRPELSDALLDLVASPLPDSLRMSAAAAIGYAAIPETQPRLLELLGERETERFAAIAIGMMGDEAAIEALKDKLLANPDLSDLFNRMMDPEGNSAVQGNRIGVVTTAMFESGAIYRRIAAAYYLKQGDDARAMGFVWNRLVTMFSLGYDGANAASAHFIRQALFDTIASEGADENTRLMACRILDDLHERGLLLRARDTEGPAEEAARAILREIALREARAASGGADPTGADEEPE